MTSLSFIRKIKIIIRMSDLVLDSTDREIVHLFLEDPSASAYSIFEWSRKRFDYSLALLTYSAIQKRVKKLKDQKVLEPAIRVNYKKLGLPLHYRMGIIVDRSQLYTEEAKKGGEYGFLQRELLVSIVNEIEKGDFINRDNVLIHSAMIAVGSSVDMLIDFHTNIENLFPFIEFVQCLPGIDKTRTYTIPWSAQREELIER